MRQTPRTWIRPIMAGLIAGLLVPALSRAQTIDPTTEGFDPARQITTQIFRPNVYILEDVSGSFTWDVYGNTVGVDGTGAAPTASWGSAAGSGSCSGTPLKCLTWSYALTVSQRLPSRMATMKNVLGNSVSIYTTWAEPSVWDAGPPSSYVVNTTWTSGTPAPTLTGPETTGNLTKTTSATPVTIKFTWTVTFSSKAVAPGAPDLTGGVNTWAWSSGAPLVGTGGTVQSPVDLIGQTADKVNWGLLTFSGNCSATQTTVAAIDTSDSGDVTTIENKLKLQSAGGLDANGTTPTMGGLAYAKTAMNTVYNNDPKKSCGRTYAVILVTDGLSNACNPNSGNWDQPCLSCPGTGCPDGGDSGYTCPNGWNTASNGLGGSGFAAAYSEALWNDIVSGVSVPIRTWVIGVSPQVGPCELNYIAYRGRTDAAAPDTGFGLDSSNRPLDCYLPGAVGATCDWPTAQTTPYPSWLGLYDAPVCNNLYPPHGNYAFFAQTASTITSAFVKIVSSFGTGNYTTSPLAVTSNPSSTTSYLSFVPASGYPNWKGNLFCYDLNPAFTTLKPPYHPLLWDAGDVLSNHGNNGMVRRIITWDPTNSNQIVWIAGATAPNPPDAGGTFTETNPATVATTLDALCGSCGITTAVVDFIRGYDGTANPPTTMTGTRRPWLLGPLMNSTPVVISAAEVWKQAQLADHSAFEQVYGIGGPNGGRHPLVWVGSSDGLAHAFDVTDGAEVMALLPPDLLYKQVELYKQYKNPAETVTGEVKDPAYHVYGVSNSLRFADIYDSSSPLTTSGGVKLNYRTVLYLTEGGRTARWDSIVSYPVGIIVNPTAGNGHIYRCTVAGTSAATEPTWPITSGGTVTDGTVTWKEYGTMGGTALHALDVTNAYPGRASAQPPTALPTPTPTPTPVTAAGTPTPTPTCAPTPTPGPPPTPTAGPTPLPTATPVPTVIPADQNYSSTTPVQPLWSVSRSGFGVSAVGKIADLGQTWSMPALGASTATQWELTIGAGFDERYPTSSVTAHAFHLNALTGALIAEYNLAGVSSGARVRSEAFADSVIFGMTAPYFRPDNKVTQSVQVDLTGQVWTMDPTTTSTTSTAIISLGGGQPLYYSVAAVGFPASNPTADIYAFGTGCFYEQSSNVSGKNAFGVPTQHTAAPTTCSGATSAFSPELVVAARQVASPNTVTYKAIPIYSTTTPLTGTTYCSDPGNQGVIRTYSPGCRTQLVAPPLLLTSLDPTVTKAEALFLIYDPDDRCGGTTSIVVVVFDTTTLGQTGHDPTITVYDAGEGASGGFAIAGSTVFISKSVIGAGGNSYASAVPNLKILPGGLGGSTNWWRELQ